ncbi:MAG: type II toxin-antitoxin system RelE/ParE family toxin [bacterium]|nr:type II toxin-antitoxin system RelE/ParE family toxin [bacterium]
MINIIYAPTFVRMYKGLPVLLKDEIKEKIELFKNSKNHKLLKVHKLKGNLSNTFSFTVNYQIRIVFEYESKNTVNLLYVGGHDELYR